MQQQLAYRISDGGEGIVTPVELLRIGWVVVAALGAARAGKNLANVLTASDQIRKSGINGVLKVRVKFTAFDCGISFAALLCGCVAGIAAMLTQPMIALGGLIAEHLLLVWLVFNMAQGWTQVNNALLKEMLDAQTDGKQGLIGEIGETR